MLPNLSRTHAKVMITLSTLLFLIWSLPASGQSRDEQGLQGTWNVRVTLISCTTGQPIAPTFSSLLAFADGGTLTGTTRNPVFQPGQRTSDFGVWHHVTGRSYTADSEAFILFPGSAPPIPSGTQRLTQSITVAGDRFESVAITRFYDTNGFLVISGCAHAIGSRFE